VPFYQPIFTLANHRVYRYECLARLLDDKQHVILPDEFLYIVQSNDEAADMTSRILELSKAYCGPRQMSWSINLFSSDLEDACLLKTIQDLCKSSSKGLCGVELHFSSVKDNLIPLGKLIKDMPNLHVTIDEIDECSEGLVAVIASGIDAIKVKADVIKEQARTEQGRATLEKYKALCDKYQCKLIAEHIEDEDTLQAVEAMNILYGQGFYLSHPAEKVLAIHNA
jgi:EAL domain-containing protein (putative c-di-GMP-specific phosphodiesterase class I)